MRTHAQHLGGIDISPMIVILILYFIRNLAFGIYGRDPALTPARRWVRVAFGSPRTLNAGDRRASWRPGRRPGS